LAFFRYTPDTLAVRPKLAAKCQFQILASGSGFVRTRSAARDAHHLLDELSEGAGFSGRCPSGREHGPEIDPGQFPILQHHLNRSIRDLGREHPMALHVLAYNLTRVMNIMGTQPLMAAMRA
jgi:hypothetical protein